MTVEEQIRDCAKRGWSRSHTASHLGIPPAKLKDMLKIMPPLAWVHPQQSFLARQHYASLKGREFLTPEQRQKVAEAQRERYRIYSLCGVRGNISELCLLWKDHVNVSSDTVARRLRATQVKDNVGLYNAFFTGPTPMNQRKRRPWKASAQH